MCGIFAYLNYLTPKTRQEVIATLIKGLERLEYRGYDSAGVSVDSPNGKEIYLVKKPGKVKVLKDVIEAQHDQLQLSHECLHECHVGVAHTRWATHGVPNEINAHPQRSDEGNEFVVVHNGIITNYKVLQQFLTKKGYQFESDTDTEVIAKLARHLYYQHTQLSFRELVEQVCLQLEGAFALCFKSIFFPGECVVTRRGSPLLIGIKTKERLETDHIPIFYSKGLELRGPNQSDRRARHKSDHDHLRPHGPELPMLRRKDSRTEFTPIGENRAAEYFFASDASAIIEHTNRVIFLEDDDVAAVNSDGHLTIHRIERNPLHKFPSTSGSSTPSGRKSASPESKAQLQQQSREITTLTMEIQEIMKGSYSSFMQKEIFEQPESIVNTMRGRVNFGLGEVVLGGIKDFIPEIRRCRRLLLIGCGTSYHSAIAARQILEELTELPVMIDLASDFLDRSTPIFRDDVCFFISQSGETADTLLALRYCKQRGGLIVGVTNTVGSSISRESHCGVHINAGPEIGVASTKAYTSQCLSLLLFALVMSEDRLSMRERRSKIIEALESLPGLAKRVLQQDDKVRALAGQLFEKRSLLVMGRGYSYATCLEGALKIKELTYMHSEGIMSGELKHGPLALIDKAMPVIMILPRDKNYTKSVNALEQIRAREGNPILICMEGDQESQEKCCSFIEVPATVDCLQGILTVIPMQMLSYHIAVLKDLNVDCPRNLAKSVTTE